MQLCRGIFHFRFLHDFFFNYYICVTYITNAYHITARPVHPLKVEINNYRSSYVSEFMFLILEEIGAPFLRHRHHHVPKTASALSGSAYISSSTYFLIGWCLFFR